MLWLLAVASVGVGGNFPLSDDWAYAHVVRSLSDGNGWDLLPWTGATLVAQAAWGAAVSSIAGFSYEALRASTLLLSLLGIASMYALARGLGARQTMAAAAAATLAFSPLWFHLSFTFMTEVPFAALCLMTAALFVRGLGNGSRAALFAAGVLAALAFLVRQHGVWLAAAAALAALLVPRKTDGGDASSGTSRIVDAACAGAVPVAVAAAWAVWATTSNDTPLALQNKFDETSTVSLLTVADAAFRGLVTLGFLFLPWAAVVRLREASQRGLRVLLFAALAAVAFWLCLRTGALMFYLPNLLHEYAVGAFTTRDIFFLSRPYPPTGGTTLRLALTVFSIASAATLCTRMVGAALHVFLPAPGTSGARDPASGSGDQASGAGQPASDTRDSASKLAAGDHRRQLAFCLLALVLSALGSLLQSHYYFDRYLIVMLPLTIACAAAMSAGDKPGLGFALISVAFATYSVAGTHDYMEWNRARWDLLDSLEERGVTARQIDGGFEYNAERLAATMRTAPTDAEARRGQPESVKSWWWVDDDEWIIAFGPLDGYAEADSRGFRRWLPPSYGRVLALRRETTDPAEASDTVAPNTDNKPNSAE